MVTHNFQVAVQFSLLSFASNLEQVANLLCAQANSASYPSWDGKQVVAYGLRGEGGDGMSAGCKLWVQLFA